MHSMLLLGDQGNTSYIGNTFSESTSECILMSIMVALLTLIVF